MKTMPWIEKYRPKNFSEIVSQDVVIKVLKNFIKNKNFPHLLFHGPPGTGKTSTIHACLKELYPESYKFMVLEINASEERGIEIVRNRIIQFVTCSSFAFSGKRKKSMSGEKSDFNLDSDDDAAHETDREEAEEEKEEETETNSLFKLVILDEADSMTADAQAILRKVIEKYTKNARFCLICNYIKKISMALQSRCVSFRFAPIKRELILDKMNYVIKKEKIEIEGDAKETIIDRSNGDMRKILNILQSICQSKELVTEKTVNDCLGYPDKGTIDLIYENLNNQSFKKCYRNLRTIIRENGYSVGDILSEIHKKIIDEIMHDTSTDTRKYMEILKNLRDQEFNSLTSTSEDLQIAALISAFKINCKTT